MFTYSFEKPQQYSFCRHQRRGQYVRDAQAIFDLLQQSPGKPIPATAPLPDRIITLGFDRPLSDSVLERLAQEGYQRVNSRKYVSDKAAKAAE